MSFTPGLRIRSVVCALLLGASVSLVVMTPAHAVDGLIVSIGWSPDTASESVKSAVAVCPAGKKVLGGGADIVDGGNEVRLTSMIPGTLLGATHLYRATAMEDGSYGANWTVYAWAICGSGVTGWEIVTNELMVGPGGQGGTNTVGLGRNCPAGKNAIGAGIAAIGGYQFFVGYLVPNGASYPGTPQLGFSGGSAGDETATTGFGAKIYVVCVDPVAGLQVVSATSVSSSVDKSVSVSCPAGTRVHGVGAKKGNGGHLFFDRIGLFGSGALAGADATVREDQPGHASDWDIKVYAVCAI